MRVHSPHQWYVDHGIDELIALKARTDPTGILNPGKIGAPDHMAPGQQHRGRLQPSIGTHHPTRSSPRGWSSTPMTTRRDPAAGRAVRPGGRRAADAGARSSSCPPGRSSTTDRTCRSSPTSSSPSRSGPTPSTRAARLTPGLDVWRLPTLAYTKSDEHSWAPGTVWLDWDTMYRTCLEIGRAVALMGAGTDRLRQRPRRQHGAAAGRAPRDPQAPRAEDLRDADAQSMSARGWPRPTARASTSTGSASTAARRRPRSSCTCAPTSSTSASPQRWVPEHLADYELHQASTAGRSAFGWLSDDFGTPGVVGDPTQASAEYGAGALGRRRSPRRSPRCRRSPASPIDCRQLMNPPEMFGGDVDSRRRGQRPPRPARSAGWPGSDGAGPHGDRRQHHSADGAGHRGPATATRGSATCCSHAYDARAPVISTRMSARRSPPSSPRTPVPASRSSGPTSGRQLSGQRHRSTIEDGRRRGARGLRPPQPLPAAARLGQRPPRSTDLTRGRADASVFAAFAAEHTGARPAPDLAPDTCSSARAHQLLAR